MTLEIEQKVESISDSTVDKGSGASGASDIITNKREIKTTALVRDNRVLVLGGLMGDTVQASENGVPWLRNLPLIGHLFKGTSKKIQKKNLMVFIHPRILHDDADSDEKSSALYNDLREHQQRFNEQELKDLLHVDKPLPALDAWPHDHKKSSVNYAEPVPGAPNKESPVENSVTQPVATPEAIKVKE